MRRAARVDANQSAIIKACEAEGATVEILGLPVDLLVGAGGRWGLLEVKSSEAEARRKTDTRRRQLEFAERHPHGGPIGTVWDEEGARRFVRVLRGG